MYAPIKKLGQNFLMDLHIAKKMVDSLRLVDDDTVIEIGPGLGVLTELLVAELDSKSSKVYAVEIDDRFVSKLEAQFGLHRNVEIVHADILKWLPEHAPTKPFKILGSLPYYITSPIVHAIVYMEQRPETAVLMVQKEVAEKIHQSKRGEGSYLSNFVQTFFDVEYVGSVDKKEFSPTPKVDGGILRLTLKEKQLLGSDREEIERYERFLHHGFKNPRKMLKRAFGADVLDSVGISQADRPQDVSVEKWIELYKSMYKS